MEKISLPIAEKLLLLQYGEKIQASKVKHAIFKELVSEKILYKIGKNKGYIQLLDKEQFDLFLQNHFSITDLEKYVSVLQQENISRADLVKVSSDSKLTSQRTFKGFLLNSYEPIEAKLNEESITLNPIPGLFHFVYDFESFVPNEEVTIVGVENAENFRYIEHQKDLFKDIQPLFISRYPQNQHADVIQWLKSIPNPYLHFGDFDFAGINIYWNEYHKHIPDKCSFFIPSDIERLLSQYGNYERYNKQKLQVQIDDIIDPELLDLIHLIHKYKKGLDQEVFQNLEK